MVTICGRWEADPTTQYAWTVLVLDEVIKIDLADSRYYITKTSQRTAGSAIYGANTASQHFHISPKGYPAKPAFHEVHTA